jgi:hypothetical protein
VPIALLALYAWRRAPERFGALQSRLPALRACLIGIAAAAVLGYALNDSGIAVPGVMLSVLMPAMVFLLIRTPEPAVRAPASRAGSNGAAGGGSNLSFRQAGGPRR